MTIEEARRILSSRGIVLRHQDGEFRVNYVRGREETAYYTNDLDDAVRTGLVMVHHGSQHHNPKRLTRAKARLILHHGEVRGYPLTEPQRGFFGARASGYPRRNAMARGYGASALPAHYRRRSRSHRLPPLAGHRIVRGGRHYRHNPGGTNWMPLVLIGAAVFLLPKLMGTSGLPFGGLLGTSVTPPGFTYLGSGYYRGPDGQTYYRSPTTGQMAVSSPASASAAMAQNVGYGLINTTIGAAGGALTSLIKGIFSPQTYQAAVNDPSVAGGTVADTSVSGGGATVTAPDVLSGAYNVPVPIDTSTGQLTLDTTLGSASDVGLTPAPMPDFQLA
jgi:hypothetical protein